MSPPTDPNFSLNHTTSATPSSPASLPPLAPAEEGMLVPPTTSPSSPDESPGAAIEERLAQLPPSPGCYLFYNRRGELLYVGKAISLRNRVRSYFHRDRDRAPKIRRLVRQVVRIEWIVVPTELHALTLECRLIKENQPRFNALLKGDRRLPRLRVTMKDPVPRVYLDWSIPEEEGRYFGPFNRQDSAEDLLDVLYRVFKLRNCDLALTGRETMRPCLYYDLGQCMAPCNREICPPEEYDEAIRVAVDFLEGRQETLLEWLNTEMESAAEELRFERAARLRDMRESVLRWMDRQNFIAVWEEASTGLSHFFLVHCARLAGHCAVSSEERAADSPAWRLALLKSLREAYAIPRSVDPLLGSIAIEELNILETWLSRKDARKWHVAPPSDPEDFAALERMMAGIESWANPETEPPFRESGKPFTGEVVKPSTPRRGRRPR